MVEAERIASQVIAYLGCNIKDSKGNPCSIDEQQHRLLITVFTANPSERVTFDRGEQ